MEILPVTSARHLKEESKQSVPDRGFYKVCVLTRMWWVQTKGEKSLRVEAKEATNHNVQPFPSDYKGYDSKP